MEKFFFFFFEAASLQAGIRIVDCSEWKRMIAVFACRGEGFTLCDSFDSYYNVSGLALILPLSFLSGISVLDNNFYKTIVQMVASFCIDG